LNGNLKWDGVITCTYNYANQLVKVIRSSDEQVLGEYKYDTLGRRIYKKAWNGTAFVETYFYYDRVQCIEERNASDTLIATYIFGNRIDEILTMERNSETYYYHENSLGSIYAVTTGTGTVAERYIYNAYGKPSFFDALGNPISQSAISNSLLFTGREYDKETGLYYYRARYYSVELGRFLQRAPEEVDDLLSLYAYCLNNPINRTDPLGLFYAHDHMRITKDIAQEFGFNSWTAMALANRNAESDLPPYSGIRQRHAQGDGDESDEGRARAIAEARASAKNDLDLAATALKSCQTKDAIGHLGRALHTLHDIVKHKGKSSLPAGHDALEPDGSDVREAENETMSALREFFNRTDIPAKKKEKIKKAYGFLKCGGIIQAAEYAGIILISKGFAIYDQTLGKAIGKILKNPKSGGKGAHPDRPPISP
jgi:RHS repeat-associated protein